MSRLGSLACLLVLVSSSACACRPDLACKELASGERFGFCVSTCRNDADCAPRACDPSSGFCVDTAKAGAPVGTACSGDDECAGACTEICAGFSICSQLCTLGDFGCGHSGGSAPSDALCAYGQSPASGNGDLGHCDQLCDCHDECRHPDAVCSPLDAGTRVQVGRAGSPRMLPGGATRTGTPCG